MSTALPAFPGRSRRTTASGTCGVTWIPSSWPGPGGTRRPGSSRPHQIIRCWDTGSASSAAAQGRGCCRTTLCATCHSTRQRSDLEHGGVHRCRARPRQAVRRGHLLGERVPSSGPHEPPAAVSHPRASPQAARASAGGVPAAIPRAEPLPGFGPCRVVVCTRQAHARRGLCRAHDVRWREQHRAGMLAVTDFGAWCRSSAPVASGHEVVLRGLAPLVQAEILFGLQERCRQGALTPLLPAADHLPSAAGHPRTDDHRPGRLPARPPSPCAGPGPAAGGAASGDVAAG